MRVFICIVAVFFIIYNTVSTVIAFQANEGMFFVPFWTMLSVYWVWLIFRVSRF